MTEFESVLMKRDNLTKEEARQSRKEAREALYDILNNGGSYDDVEDMMGCMYGLEMDFIFDIM